MDTYIILSSEQTHKQMTKKSKPRNQEICWIWIVPQPIDTRRDTLSLTGISAPTSIEIFDRAFSFPVFHRRAHIFLSLSVGGGGGKQGKFLLAISRPTINQPFSPHRDGEVLRQGTERPMNTNQRGGRLFNYKPSSTDVSNFPRRLPSIFATAGGERRGRGGINDRLRNFSGKVRRVSTHRDEWTVCNSDCGESFSFRARLFCNQAMRDPRVGEIGMGEKRAKRFVDFSFFGGTCFF